jgi:hypothetical protein
MFRLLPALGAFGLLLGSGVVHRLWTGAWTASNEPAASAARLADVPLTIGDWKGQPSEINQREVEVAQLAGYLLRHYVRSTGEKVTVLLVCGRPGPICVHTPDVCFTGQGGFEVDGEQAPFRMEEGVDAPPAEFIKASMVKKGGGAEQWLRVYWSWKAGGPWRAPKHQRLVFGGSPALYKLYLVCYAAPGAKLPEQDPCVDLMRDLLPELEKALNPTS